MFASALLTPSLADRYTPRLLLIKFSLNCPCPIERARQGHCTSVICYEAPQVSSRSVNMLVNVPSRGVVEIVW